MNALEALTALSGQSGCCEECERLNRVIAEMKGEREQVEHTQTWGDRGGGLYWQSRCCDFTTIGNGGPYNTAEEAKKAARAGCIAARGYLKQPGQLSAEQTKRFLEALDQPPQHKERLSKLLKHPTPQGKDDIIDALEITRLKIGEAKNLITHPAAKGHQIRRAVEELEFLETVERALSDEKERG